MFTAIAAQSKSSPLSLGASGERMLNMFLRPSEGVSTAPAIGRTGLSELVNLGGIVRAMVTASGVVYAVADGKFWSVSGGIATALGSVPDSAATYIALNSGQIGIVADGRFFLWDGATVTNYATGALFDLTGITSLGGYFIVSGSSGGRADAIGWSGIDNGAAWNGLDFAFAENEGDALIGLVEDHGELWLLGSKTVEVWYQTGDDPPFAPNQGASMEYGCLDGGAVAKLDNAVFWVTEEGTVVRATGTSPQVISTREVEEMLAGSDIVGGFGFMDRGHKFYAVTRTGDTSLVYDVTTGLWCEFSTGINNLPWIAREASVDNGVWYFGTSTGHICTQSGYEDIGEVIVAEIVSKPEAKSSFFTVAEVRLSVLTGAGDIGRDAQIMLQTSKDGYSWGFEKWRNMGRIGERSRRVRWNGLGAFERFQIRLRITDPVQRDIYGVTYA